MLSVIMLNVPYKPLMLIVVMLSVIMLNVPYKPLMLSVIMLNVTCKLFMLNVVAPS
jgi:hypothetical protein